MASDDPSRRASAASSSEISQVDPNIIPKSFSKDEKLSGKFKVKKALPKPSKLKEGESNDGKLGIFSRSGSPDSQLMNDINAESKAIIPNSRPAEDNADLIQCKHCKKPMNSVEKSVAESHVKICLQKKQDRARKKKEAKEAKARDAKEKSEAKDKEGDTQMEDAAAATTLRGGQEAADETSTLADGTTSKSAKKSITKETGDTPKKSKKRKADGEGGDKEPKKKKAKKDEPPKPKVPKPKGPVDVEKQCGVQLPNGGNCARSLTCKSHSMGAKRSVPGRSLPYDILLGNYQKKNQAKQQKAAMDANAPLPEDLDPSHGGPIDSDEEKDAVMAAISRSRPQPLAQHVFVPTRCKYGTVRMRDMLGNALGGRNSIFGSATAANATASTGAGASTTVTANSFAQSSSSVGAEGAQAPGSAGPWGDEGRRATGPTMQGSSTAAAAATGGIGGGGGAQRIAPPAGTATLDRKPAVNGAVAGVA